MIPSLLRCVLGRIEYNSVKLCGEACGRMRQGDCHTFNTSWGYIVRSSPTGIQNESKSESLQGGCESLK